MRSKMSQKISYGVVLRGIFYANVALVVVSGRLIWPSGFCKVDPAVAHVIGSPHMLFCSLD